MSWIGHIAVLLGAHLLAAQPPSEYEVKAAFLLNFARFAEWREVEGGNTPLAVCVIGEDPFGARLDQTLEGETVGNRRILPRRLRSPAKGCDIAFFPNTHRELTGILAEMPPGVLTVGEGESFVRNGGMIGFVMENRRVRFDINMTAVRNAGLRLSSRLLQVARSVK